MKFIVKHTILQIIKDQLNQINRLVFALRSGQDQNSLSFCQLKE